MDYLEKNIDWLESKLKPLLKGYFIFQIKNSLGFVGMFVELHVGSTIEIFESWKQRTKTTKRDGV